MTLLVSIAITMFAATSAYATSGAGGSHRTGTSIGPGGAGHGIAKSQAATKKQRDFAGSLLAPAVTAEGLAFSLTVTNANTPAFANRNRSFKYAFVLNYAVRLLPEVTAFDNHSITQDQFNARSTVHANEAYQFVTNFYNAHGLPLN
jgi:hypothetical protein